MAGIQPARVGVGETIEEFMARRGREAARRQAAEAAGRDTWAASNDTGQGWAAPRTADVVALGVRVLDARERQPLAAAQTAPMPHRAATVATLQPASAPSLQPAREAGSRYGSLYAPPPSDLAELRRQQAEFARTTREISNQNSWMAVPALAPAAVVLGLGGASALGTGVAGSEGAAGPLSFLGREAWQRARRALTRNERTAFREKGRAKFERANNIAASEMKAEVHHSDPLEWAHLKPNADPNRLANRWGLRPEAHAIASREWDAFRRALKGRIPTQAELMEAKLRIDRLVEPYIRRAGVPRSNKPPNKGGPR
ncbi:hypothetical protein [Phenylobacterium sp.]|uniref:hypothetical protein n=1 Tax=Phenylobacterium sp. TaxID=1871053 RepID=UPI002FC6C240